jgi:hypothetical protein
MLGAPAKKWKARAKEDSGQEPWDTSAESDEEIV